MALNTKNKKTSLEEDAFIYEKRDEEESEKSKWDKMNREQKVVHFKTYYLRPLIVVCLVVAIGVFFLYKDVIQKRAVVYQCAVVNEQAMEIPIEEFGNRFVESMVLEPERNEAVFSLYYTNQELASQSGTSASNDLTRLSSMIYAASLDSMIASEEDLQIYLENQFFVDLTELLSEEERNVIQDKLYIPDSVGEFVNEEGHPYGIFLDGNKEYQQIFEGGASIVEKPILGIVFNSENKEISKQFLYFLFPELKSVS